MQGEIVKPSAVEMSLHLYSTILDSTKFAGVRDWPEGTNPCYLCMRYGPKRVPDLGGKR